MIQESKYQYKRETDNNNINPVSRFSCNLEATLNTNKIGDQNI